MPIDTIEWRCTRKGLYRHNCAGRDDLTVRQGYYVDAPDRESALVQMREDFPDDQHGFTAQDTSELE